MAVQTTLAQLEEVQAAIQNVLTSQAFATADRTVTRARLAELTLRETTLLDRYHKEQGRGLTRNVAVFQRG